MVVTIEDIETVSVVGAGQMGRGIGAVAALAGYEVYLTDVDESQLEEAQEEIAWSYEKTVEKGHASESETSDALDRITFTTDFAEAIEPADFVTEAAVEKQSVKEDIFADLDETAPEDAILATNTSGLNITRLAEVTDRPDQVLGTHCSTRRC
jgi:enoyl-CoA hydratase/3-hydroxyacyl-CoA dehydrogenase